MEAARTAAINQEIKRVLTEVLLKVAAGRLLIKYKLGFQTCSDHRFFHRSLMNFLMK